MSNETPSDTVLEETPGRALQLLSGISRKPVIYSALIEFGYTEADHQEGWNLLHEVSGYNVKPARIAETSEASAALVAVDAWDEPNFRIIRATLARRFPEQRDFVFADDLQPATGAESLLSVGTLLDRLDALDSGHKYRKAHHKKDKEAVELLARRGITAAVRKHLREQIKIASTPTKAAVVKPAVDPEKRREGLIELHAWFSEWSEIARIAIKRRDYLIFLGLAQRRTPEKKEPAPSPK